MQKSNIEASCTVGRGKWPPGSPVREHGPSPPSPLGKGLSGLTPRTCVHFLHYSPQMFRTLEPTAEPDSGPAWISLPGSVAEDGLCP